MDSQSDLLSQVLRNSLPADLFDQAGSAFSEPEVDPEFISEGGEGNELPNAYNVYNLRQQPPPQQEDMISPTHGQQVSFDSARIHHPSSIWGRMDGDGDDVVRDDLPEKESDLNVNRLARLYEALLNANRN